VEPKKQPEPENPNDDDFAPPPDEYGDEWDDDHGGDFGDSD